MVIIFLQAAVYPSHGAVVNADFGRSPVSAHCVVGIPLCGGAILTWIIEGAKKFIAAGGLLKEPECVRAATQEYFADNDWITAFIEDCCDVSPTDKTGARDLYNEYRSHCARTGEWVRGSAAFKEGITGAGYSWKKERNGAFYYGLKLKVHDF